MHSFKKTAAVILFLTLLQPALARAEQRKVYSYAPETVYSSAIRLLRVELNYEIIEKDQEGGYIIFNYLDTQGKKHRASLEVMSKNAEKSQLTQAICSIPEVPSYLELDLLDKLAIKLNSDQR